MHTIILANYTGRIAVLCAAFLAHASAHGSRTDTTTDTRTDTRSVASELTSNGLHGYIASHAESVPAEFHYGAGFYATVWPLIARPIAGFQSGSVLLSELSGKIQVDGNPI